MAAELSAGSPSSDTRSGRGRMKLPSVEELKALPTAAIAGLACECAVAGDVEGMQSLVEAGADMDCGTPYDQRTPLHLAAACGNFEMTKFLVEECGAALQRDRFGLLPIHDAVQNNHVEVRRYLQSKRLSELPALPRSRSRAASIETVTPRTEAYFMNTAEQKQEVMVKVFELIVKEGVFSYTVVQSEVHHFFQDLNLHPIYFEHFTPLQVAKHVHCLIAAKRVALATGDHEQLRFVLENEHSGFFLTTVDCPNPTEAQKLTEERVAEFISQSEPGKVNVSMIYMASEGSAFPQGKRIGIFAAERDHFEQARFEEDETSLEVLASSRFLKSKTNAAKEQYQVIMEDVVASRRSCVRIVEGSAYPGPYPGGYVLLFGTAETAGRSYLTEIYQATRFCNLVPRRLYVETFANGVMTYSLFLPNAQIEEMRKLERTVMYSSMLKAFPGKSEVIFNDVMQAAIPHEVGLYLLAAVKFVYTFFPKERYARQYTDVHKVLESNPTSQRKLEDLYKLCMKELLSTERIYDLVHRNLDLAKKLFQDFRSIALGEVKPHYNEQLGQEIDKACPEGQDRQILRMFLTFNQSILLTNFFKEHTPGAIAFRLSPSTVLKDRPTALYPEVPYGIYMVVGRDFLGFHTRFRDVARGGIRLILSRDRSVYERNFATLFEECYNLALTQQHKNKDIPEGGAKGVILPDSGWPNSAGGNILSGSSTQSEASRRICFIRYLDALLDCMLPEQSGVFSGHMDGRKEYLFFGPDENTAGYMDLGATMARSRGYRFWRALTTGKSVKYGGVPHDVYGMTTASVHTYVLALLEELGEEEEKITKVQTGGPDGDLGSNEILISKDKTIAVVDGSGVAYDPNGLDRQELVRLAQRRSPINQFGRAYLGAGGFLVTIEETDVKLPDGSTWRTGAELRDRFHLTDFATADLFVPCGGRPSSVNSETVKHLFTKEGRPKFRMIVEGANLFFSDQARQAMEKAGVHIFRDASTNKGGVTSSSLEVFAALALPDNEHSAQMCYDPQADASPPEFYATYVMQILDTIVDNARQEFRAIWQANQKDGIPKVDATRQLSIHINKVKDGIEENMDRMSTVEREQLVKSVLRQAVPPLMVERLGVEGIMRNVPENYVLSAVSAWVASRYVYQSGLSAGEISFFLFMRQLMQKAAEAEQGKQAD